MFNRILLLNEGGTAQGGLDQAKRRKKIISRLMNEDGVFYANKVSPTSSDSEGDDEQAREMDMFRQEDAQFEENSEEPEIIL